MPVHPIFAQHKTAVRFGVAVALLFLAILTGCAPEGVTSGHYLTPNVMGMRTSGAPEAHVLPGAHGSLRHMARGQQVEAPGRTVHAL